MLKLFNIKFNLAEKSVRSDFFFQENMAIYRGSKLGCVLLSGAHKNKITPFQIEPYWKKVKSNHSPIFETKKDLDSKEFDAISKVVSDAFEETQKSKLRKTRAVVIIKNNHLIAEQYASGFSKDSLFPGWSMTKSVMATLVGIAIKDGRIGVEEKN